MAPVPPAPSSLGSLEGIGEVFSVVSVVRQLGPSVRRLDPGQRSRFEQLAHTKGVICPRCGSARLSGGDIAHTHTRYVGVWLWCKNEEVHLGRSGRKQYFKVSLEEAGGIDVWGQRKELSA